MSPLRAVGSASTALTSSSVGGKPTRTFFTFATYAAGDTASNGTGGVIAVELPEGAASCFVEDEHATAQPTAPDTTSSACATARRRVRPKRLNICGTDQLLEAPTASRCRAR